MKTLTWHCGECSGGLCDRLLGMISCYLIANELGRKFYIKWDHNDMSDIFTIAEKYNFYNGGINHFKFINLMSDKLREYFDNGTPEIDWNDTEHVIMWSNMNLFFNYCNNRPYIQYKEKILSAINNIFTEFLIPTETVAKYIENCGNFDAGIHIRTHDSQLNCEKKRLEQIPYIRYTLEKCKIDIIKHNFINKIFIATDCILVPEIAKEIFGDKYELVFNNGPIVHSGRQQTELSKDGLIRVILDLFFLTKCDKLYIGWNSNFSRFGLLLRPNRPFLIYEHPKSLNTLSECDILELLNYFSNGWRMY